MPTGSVEEKVTFLFSAISSPGAKRKLREGNVPEAEAMYRKVLAEQPECGEAMHYLGMAAARRGKLDDAVAMVRKSIELSPQSAEYHNNLATVPGRMGRPIEALGAAQQALDLKPDQPEAWATRAWRSSASATWSTGTTSSGGWRVPWRDKSERGRWPPTSPASPRPCSRSGVLRRRSQTLCWRARYSKQNQRREEAAGSGINCI